MKLGYDAQIRQGVTCYYDIYDWAYWAEIETKTYALWYFEVITCDWLKLNLLKRLHQNNNYTDNEQREKADEIQNLTNEIEA